VTHVTDIIGEEDFFGDMDFKVSGTRDGITGIQLDLKARGLWFDEIDHDLRAAPRAASNSSRRWRTVIPEPRGEISAYAPRIFTLMIDPEKIGKLIGPGGKTIRGIQEKYGVNHRRRGRRHGDHRLRPMPPPPSRPRSEMEAICRRDQGRHRSTTARSSPRRTSARSSRSPPAPTACATSPSWPTAS
jgi:hypothetical protein